MDQHDIQKAASLLKNSKYAIAFTGAGISVESGVPPFRGPSGIWAKYDPKVLDLDYFYTHSKESWTVIREIFYRYFEESLPNPAHIALANLEQRGIIKAVITQNIDNLHQEAGSKKVIEFHGNSKRLLCIRCNKKYPVENISVDDLPPRCACGGLLKPDFIFFGEGIPEEAYRLSMDAVNRADVMLIIGSTGEVMPAAQLPFIASQQGATCIEINPQTSKFTPAITSVHIKGKAGEMMKQLEKILIK